MSANLLICNWIVSWQWVDNEGFPISCIPDRDLSTVVLCFVPLRLFILGVFFSISQGYRHRGIYLTGIMEVVTARHIQMADDSSMLEPHWGYVDRVLPCTNDAGSCEYLDAVYVSYRDPFVSRSACEELSHGLESEFRLHHFPCAGA